MKSDVAEASNIKRHIDHAQGYLMLKMYADALAEIDQVFAVAPDHKDALYWQGMVYLDQGKLKEAETPFLRLVAIDPEQVHAYVHLAWIYRRTTSIEKAIETIQKALALNPRFPIALYNLSCYRAVQGNAEEALKLLAEAITQEKQYRDLARTDSDFESLRHSVEFQKLMEM